MVKVGQTIQNRSTDKQSNKQINNESYHKVSRGNAVDLCVCGLLNEFEAFTNLLLRVPRHSTDLLERPWHCFLSTRYVKAGSCHSVVGPSFQVLLLMDLLEESLASIL